MAATPANPLRFYPSPPKLKRMALTKLTVEVACNEIARDATNIQNERFFFSSDWMWKRRSKLNERLSIDVADEDLRRKIIDEVETAVVRMNSWSMNHSKNVFNGEETGRLIVKFSRDFVWNSDGNLNFVKTANKLISGTKLNLKQKYAMMCVYCMEDDIRQMYESYDWVEDVVDEEEFRHNVFVYYWDCILCDDYPDNPYDDDDRSLEKCIVDGRPGNEATLGYFFDQLDHDERLDFATNVMVVLPGWYMKHVLPKYTVSELRRIFDECLTDIMVTIVVESDSKLHPLELWNFAKTSTRGKVFVKMMSEVFKLYIDVFDGDYPDWLAGFGLDMWKNTPARLKQFVFKQDREYKFILKWNRWYGEVSGEELRDDTILLLMLADADAEYRRKFWLSEWTRLVPKCKGHFILKLMNACLADPRELNEFRKKILKSEILREHLLKVFSEGHIFDLNRFLDDFVPEPNERKVLIDSLSAGLVRMPDSFVHYGPKDVLIDALGEFINKAYGAGSDAANECATTLIRSSFVKFTKNWHITDEIFNSNVHIAERLCDEQQLQSVKDSMLTWFRNVGEQDDLEEGYEWEDEEAVREGNPVWRKILTWCLGDKDKVDALREEVKAGRGN